MEEEKKEKKKKKKVPLVEIGNGMDKMDKMDMRGIQTLFRTLSRNHYNLLRMVDNKASIILTINSIIISLLMGAMYMLPEENRKLLSVGAKILINFSVASMIFALIAMLPHKYLGKKYKKSGYKGSLYASNFVDLSLAQFKVEFNRIITNGKTVYDELTTDLYFLGKVIHRKQRMLIISVLIFLIGLMSTFVTTMMSGYMLPQ